MDNSTTTASLDGELALLRSALEGGQNDRYLALAVLTVYVYDYLLTFEKEIKYFWSGPWNLTRALFFFNRYLPMAVFVLALICLFQPNLSYEFCYHAIPGTMLLGVIGVFIVQAIIVLRIWYIFSTRQIERLVVVFAFIACNVAIGVIYGRLWSQLIPAPLPLPGLQIVGCNAPVVTDVWKLYIPNLVLHTVLFIATTIPVLRPRLEARGSPLLIRLVKDGGTYYIVVFVAALLSTIGSLQRSHLQIMIPAVYSNALLSLIATATTRLMLSIRSLAAALSVDPQWLLNNAELSRVNWRKGSHDGELIVEIEPASGDEDLLELETVSDHGHPAKRSEPGTVYTSRVGYFDDIEANTFQIPRSPAAGRRKFNMSRP